MVYAMTVMTIPSVATVKLMILSDRAHKDRDECWEGLSDSRRTVRSSVLERKHTESYKHLLSFTTTLISDGKL
jgi:hypothetical protein